MDRAQLQYQLATMRALVNITAALRKLAAHAPEGQQAPIIDSIDEAASQLGEMLDAIYKATEAK
jgi:hypothetical protein